VAEVESAEGREGGSVSAGFGCVEGLPDESGPASGHGAISPACVEHGNARSADVRSAIGRFFMS
jgi:hypothetical protein